VYDRREMTLKADHQIFKQTRAYVKYARTFSHNFIRNCFVTFYTIFGKIFVCLLNSCQNIKSMLMGKLSLSLLWLGDIYC